ncbi:uncharacterized protein MEPE_05365 [Melanopsichium pennsylvanicum]|uniref:Sec20 C-terminal domain-containing protein n=1 Tax=Melanopsichium pennsylvanicum TaxID=63383 RepID=A0AAJ5C785_9BASI|nr:uncharacterized protein MEPE_05365 [Melanopsichium pennsylvanicum]
MASPIASGSRSLISPDLRTVYASFSRYAGDVINHQIPRLQTCSSASLLTDYEAEILSSIHGLKRQLNDLKFAVDEAESEAERREIASLVLEATQKLEEQNSRKALLSARRSIQNARTLQDRSHLNLAADSAKERTGGRGSASSSGQDKLITASQDVTDALRSTVSLMASELEKSAMSSQLLDESTQTISSLSFQYGSLSTLMSNSVNLIKTMEREDLIGKGMVALSFVFFLGCVGWIVYARIVSKGVGLIGFFFRLFGLDKLLGGMGGRGSADLEEKAKLLKAAAQQSSTTLESVAAAVSTAMTSAVSAAATAAATQAGQAKNSKLEEKVVDLQDDLEQLVGTVLPDGEDKPIGHRDLPQTRQNTLPIQHVEL